MAMKLPSGKMPMMEKDGSSPSVFIKPGGKDGGRKSGKKASRSGGRSSKR